MTLLASLFSCVLKFENLFDTGKWDPHLTISREGGNTLLELATRLDLCILIFLKISSLLICLCFSFVLSVIIGQFLTRYLLLGRAICALILIEGPSFFCCSTPCRKFVLFTLYYNETCLFPIRFGFNCGYTMTIDWLISLAAWSYIRRRWLSFLNAADFKLSRLLVVLTKGTVDFNTDSTWVSKSPLMWSGCY
jgi:hypothetical protein